MSEEFHKESEKVVEQFICPSMNLMMQTSCHLTECPAHKSNYPEFENFTPLTRTQCMHIEVSESSVESPAFSKDRVSIKDLNLMSAILGVSQSEMRKHYEISMYVTRCSIKLLLLVNQISETLCQDCYRSIDICRGDCEQHKEIINEALDFYSTVVDNRMLTGGALWKMASEKDEDLALPPETLKKLLSHAK